MIDRSIDLVGPTRKLGQMAWGRAGERCRLQLPARGRLTSIVLQEHNGGIDDCSGGVGR